MNTKNDWNEFNNWCLTFIEVYPNYNLSYYTRRVMARRNYELPYQDFLKYKEKIALLSNPIQIKPNKEEIYYISTIEEFHNAICR